MLSLPSKHEEYFARSPSLRRQLVILHISVLKQQDNIQGTSHNRQQQTNDHLESKH